MFFDGWYGLLRIILVGTLSYLALVILLRVSGKRTLAKMNAFDLVITVALGSTLSTVLLSKDVALAEGITGLALLVGLQFVVAWTSIRSKRIRRITRSSPTLLVFRGELQRGNLRESRVTVGELESAVRKAHLARPEDAHAVVLESDGSLSVIPTPLPGMEREDSAELRRVR